MQIHGKNPDTRQMRSKVSEALAAEDRERNLSVPVENRFRLMLEMGEAQLRDFMIANDLERDDAIRRIEHARQRGRRASRCMEEVIDESRPGSASRPR